MLSHPPSPRALLRRFRTPLLGLALGAGLLMLGWERLQARLGQEAIRQAAAGQSQAVATMRSDWTASVIPTALSAGGRAGADARRVATVRVDLVIARARRGDTQPFVELAEGVLTAIRGLDGLPTDAGAEWAEWLTPRLVEAAAILPADRRLSLLASADKTLATLAARPRRREPPVVAKPAPPEPTQQLAIAPAASPRTEEAPPETPPPPRPEPLAITITQPKSKPTPAPKPAPWRPEWGAEPAPKATRSPAGEAPIAEKLSVVPEDAEPDDIQLLAKLIELAALAPPETREPSARGPTKAPGRHHDAAATARRELAAVRNELARRGYRSVTERQVKALLSENAVDRIALAERMAVDRSGDAIRILLLLSKDPAGEVRAAAIGVLASSANRVLLEMAAELAARDPDPRVGRLAAGLRERLR